jgi:excisionase family DNA binding protein
MSADPINFTIPDALVDLIAERVAAILAAKNGDARPEPSKRWLTIDEAADYIGSTRKRIYDLRSAGRLSRTGDGSRVLVNRQELDDLVGGVQ